MTTRYTIEIEKPSGETEHIPMQGTRTDNGAVRRMRWFLKQPEARVGLVYLTWFRSSDGAKGYINPDGSASPVGVNWQPQLP